MQGLAKTNKQIYYAVSPTRWHRVLAKFPFLYVQYILRGACSCCISQDSRRQQVWACGWASITMAFVRSTWWPAANTCSPIAATDTSPFLRARQCSARR